MGTRFLLATSLLFAALPARADERALTQLKLTATPGKPPIDLWLMRGADEDGGLTIKVVARGVGPKPQAITVYTGGGGDEGPGDADAKSITMTAFELVNGFQGARVDFTYRVPEGKHKEIQTDTWIVGFQGKTHKLIDQLRTRFSQEKSKYCRERAETALQALVDAGEAVLVASTARTVEAVYGEDDLPMDPTCRAPNGVERKAYKLEGLVEHTAAPPAPGSDQPPPAGDQKAPDTKAPETKAPDTKAPDAKAPSQKAPDAKAPPAKAPAADAKAPPGDKAPPKPAPTDKPAATDDDD
jgi:hypothetical protein